jgi:hypothetical protein
MYRATNNPKYLYRAIKFQDFVVNTPIVSDPTIMRVPTPYPYSFFFGSYCGAIVLWSDLLTDPLNAHMPAFEPYL